MDRRTLFFVLALTLTLFCVNLFFEQRNGDDLRKWNEQQLAKKSEKLINFTKEVESKTASVAALPISVIYSDSEGTHQLTSGIKGNQTVLAFAWSEELPKTVYVGGPNEKTKFIPFELVQQPLSPGSLVVYRQSAGAMVNVTTLPEFGRYDLQLIVPSPIGELGEEPTVVYLGDYTDGHLEIPANKIASLQKELGKGESQPPLLAIHDAFVLLKTAEGYLPAAILQSGHQEMIPLDSLPALSGLTAKMEKKDVVATGSKSSEKFYVLETPYQQLVFSNYGGALVEINLPFQTKKDQQSVVKEIEFDKDMVQKHPQNAHFPAHAYYTAPDKAGDPFVENTQGTLGGYYPLLRRDLIEKDKRRSVRVQPRYYALNIVSQYPETAELVYTVKSFNKETIVFEVVQGHRKITKSFSVASEAQAPYCIDVMINIEGDSRGLWLTSGIPEVEWISGAPAPVLKYRMTRNHQAEVETIDLPKDSLTVTSSTVDWVCNSNGFLGMILDPLSGAAAGYSAQYVPGTVVPSRLVEIDQEYQTYKAENLPGYMLLLPLANSGGTMHFRVFAGPFASSVLKTVDQVYSNAATGYNPDYIACQSFHGWFSFISEPFAKFLFVLMDFFHMITGSWALSIVLLTVALRIMLYPLNAWSTKSMVKMQQIAPELTAIQEKNKKDPKKAQLEVMNLYRERGINPVSGCLPLLIQMPFLVGMFDLLKSTFELRGASFIPGWIDNLTAPDVLFSWGTPIFFIGNQFHVLPILLGVVMFLQQRMMSTLPKDVSKWTDQQRQQRAMGNIMAVVFTVMFYNFPSGLNIYWLSSMLLGMLQQYQTTKRLNQQAKVVAPVKK